MANLIVDEGNTLCKVAVMDKSEVLCEVAMPNFDMEQVADMVARYGVEQAVVASTRGGAEHICEQLRERVARVLHFSSQTEVPIGACDSSRAPAVYGSASAFGCNCRVCRGFDSRDRFFAVRPGCWSGHVQGFCGAYGVWPFRFSCG